MGTLRAHTGAIGCIVLYIRYDIQCTLTEYPHFYRYCSRVQHDKSASDDNSIRSQLWALKESTSGDT